MANLRNIILELAKKQKKVKTVDVLDILEKKLSRTYVSKIINQIVKEGKLIKGGSTAGAFYVLPENKELVFSKPVYEKSFKREGLEEHEVLDDISHTDLYLGLKDNVRSIFNYTFSEMLNNAIEHSKSKSIKVIIEKEKEHLSFIINDFGIGIFKNIMKKKKLNSEIESIQELLKGKTTTMPQSHSGEGIFFTSKISDRFTLDSYNYQLIIDNDLSDIFVGEEKSHDEGTSVIFEISLNTKKHLVDIFKKYQTNQDTMAFDKTEVKIKLYTMGTIHVSRSQARRVLSGLDKFVSVVLDFDKVPMIGQGFADEIFRVYRGKHPDTKIKAINANEATEFMIARVDTPKKK